MNIHKAKNERLERRHRRVRSKVSGTAERPRLAVHRSVQYISAQLIDDASGNVLVSASDRKDNKTGTKTERAQAVGKQIAELAKEKGIATVVFDRGGRLYHGRVKALADSAREGGLNF